FRSVRLQDSAGLPAAVDDVLVRCQFPQAAGAAGVEAVGADADLGPQTELAPVVEAGAGVDDHRGGVDRGREPPGRVQIAGDDRVGVVRAVGVNVPDRVFEVVDDLHREN